MNDEKNPGQDFRIADTLGIESNIFEIRTMIDFIEITCTNLVQKH